MKLFETKDGQQVFKAHCNIEGRKGGWTILHHISETVNKGDILAMEDGYFTIREVVERGLTHDNKGYTLTMVKIKYFDDKKQNHS